jgi:hypothetical protein
MKRMRRRTKTKRRNSPALCLLALGATLLSAQVAERTRSGEPYAVVAGTVFLESGVAQPGARVALFSAQEPGRKLQEKVSSPRGEFSFRVPPGPGAYRLTASLRGFVTATKDVEIVAQEQIHATLLMERESK